MFMATVLGLAANFAEAQFDDDFNSPTPKPQWAFDFDDLSLSQSGGVVNGVVTSGPPPESEGVFVSSDPTWGFYMYTYQDFQVQIDYSFTSYSSLPGLVAIDDDDLGVFFGVAADPNGNNFAGIARSKANIGGNVVAQPLSVWRLDNVTDFTLLPNPGSDTGTFTLTYDALTDRFTVTDGSSVFEIPNFGPRGDTGDSWDTGGVYVMFGIRSQTGGVASATTSFDNFNINYGIANLVPIPEPTTAMLLAAGGGLMLMRRRR